MKTCRRFALLLFASHLLTAGCAANRRQAGTGDVAFRLLWDGVTDLDLFVQDPSGACIFFGNRQSQAGGILDVDCNGGSDFLCEVPIENVYWPSATAPAGEYLFWVHAHSLIPAEAPLSYRLQLLHGQEVFWLQTGTVRSHEELHGPFVYRFPTGKTAALFQGDSRPPLCAGRESGVLISERSTREDERSAAEDERSAGQDERSAREDERSAAEDERSGRQDERSAGEDERSGTEDERSGSRVGRSGREVERSGAPTARSSPPARSAPRLPRGS